MFTSLLTEFAIEKLTNFTGVGSLSILSVCVCGGGGGGWQSQGGQLQYCGGSIVAGLLYWLKAI